jgi:hypothetical protein
MNEFTIKLTPQEQKRVDEIDKEVQKLKNENFELNRTSIDKLLAEKTLILFKNKRTLR